MFEVYYRPPANPDREAELTDRVSRLGGRLDYRECPKAAGRGICLTYEFENLNAAEEAASALRTLGEHVEGPETYSE